VRVRERVAYYACLALRGLRMRACVCVVAWLCLFVYLVFMIHLLHVIIVDFVCCEGA